jgi:hypothetical protein
VGDAARRRPERRAIGGGRCGREERGDEVHGPRLDPPPRTRCPPLTVTGVAQDSRAACRYHWHERGDRAPAGAGGTAPSTAPGRLARRSGVPVVGVGEWIPAGAIPAVPTT